MRPGHIAWLFGGIAAALGPAPALGTVPKPGGTPALELGVPKDVHLMYCSWPAPQRAFIRQHYDRVWSALSASGIFGEIKVIVQQRLIDLGVPPMQDEWAGPVKSFQAVDWKGLLEGQWVGMVRLTVPLPEVLLVFADRTARARQNADDLARVLKTVAEKHKDLFELTESALAPAGGRLVVLSMLDGPLHLVVGRRDHMILLGNSADLAKVYLSLLGPQADSGRLVDQPKFKTALARLSKPRDSLTYVDVHGLLEGIEDLIAPAAAAAEQAEPAAADVMRIIDALHRRIDALDVFVSVQRTEGRGVLHESYLSLLPDAEKTVLYQVMFRQHPFEHFDKYIPKETIEFRVGGGANYSALYRAILELVENDLPHGADILADWARAQDQAGISIQKDILDWISGEYAVMTLPTKVLSPLFSNRAYVLMIRVRDVTTARKQIDRVFAALQAKAQQQGRPPVRLQPADLGEAGFSEVFAPELMVLMLRPVFGFHQDWLIVGTSSEAVRRVLNTANGQAPTVLEHPQLKALTFFPKGPIVRAYFADLRNLGHELGRALSLVGWAASSSPRDRTAGAFARILGKLGPVLHAVNFLENSVSVTVRQDRAFITKRLTTYRRPTSRPMPRPAATAPAAMNH